MLLRFTRNSLPVRHDSPMGCVGLGEIIDQSEGDACMVDPFSVWVLFGTGFAFPRVASALNRKVFE